MKFEWKIDGVQANDGLITQAKYHCRAEQNDLAVETEGTWFFKEPKLTVPYADVTEKMVIGWIKADNDNLVEKRLAEQIANLESQSAMSLPWAPQVFTPEI